MLRKSRDMLIMQSLPADCCYSKVPRPTALPAKVKTTFESTCAAVEPVLGGILMHARDGKHNALSP
jgi:hypothetical protein